MRSYTIYKYPDGTEEKFEGTSIALDDTICANCGAPVTIHKGYVDNGDYDSGGYYWHCSCGAQAYEVIDSPKRSEYEMDEAERERLERDAADAWEQTQFENGNVYQDFDGTWRTDGHWSPPEYEG